MVASFTEAPRVLYTGRVTTTDFILIKTRYVKYATTNVNTGIGNGLERNIAKEENIE
jgi:hypothetical protein